MATIPQKHRLSDDTVKSDDIPQSAPLSTTPSATNLSTASSKPQAKKQKPIINKYQPYIPYKFSDFLESTNKLTFAESQKVPGFNGIEDIPYSSRRGFQYHVATPNPLLPIIKFSGCERAPYEPSFSISDRSMATLVTEDFQSITTEKGWVSSRATLPVTSGTVYFEYEIVIADTKSHVRVGIARREASLEAPVGFDGYGYGLRDITGQGVHLSRPSVFMEEGFKSGDVIGILISLPSQDQTENNIKNVVRDQIAVRYRNRLYLEKFDYVPTTQMEHLLNPLTFFGEKAVPDSEKFKPEVIPGSFIKVFKNGIDQGIVFKDLYEFRNGCSQLGKNATDKTVDNGTLGYYPMGSVFGGGIVKLNSGPDFKFKPKDEDFKGYWELYEERIADDMVWDIIDEVEAESIQESIQASKQN